MDSFPFPFLAVVFLIITAATWLISFRRRMSLPPGPTPLPIIGNMLQLGSQRHEAFTELSKQYGPLMSIHLGSLYTVVVSSPEMAKEILLKHGQVFSGRTAVQAMDVHDHVETSLGFVPIGDEWRDMRKLCKEQMFSSQSLVRSQDLRKQKLLQLLDHAQKCSEEGRTLNFTEASFVTTTNVVSEILFSKQDAEFDSPATTELKKIINTASTIAAVPNYADYFPILRPFDLQGVKRLAEVNFGRLLGIMDGYLHERIQFRRENPSAPKKDDFLDVIVDSLQAKDNNLTLKHYTHLMMELYIGASAMNTIGMEWIMQELIWHPEKMAKVKAELKSVMGEEKVVDDSKISKLSYMQAVVKEVMRLHPPVRMVPRKAERDQVVNGYLIPKGTRVFINAWGMGRDSTIWKNPLSFQPERFLDLNIDYKGRDYELIPFGSGRRVCPGMPLANWVMHTLPPTLIHNFNWRMDATNGFSMGPPLDLKIVPYKP